MHCGSVFEPRSVLFLPADSERFVASAHARGADVLVLDLEDAVAPSAKTSARHALSSALPRLHAQGCQVFVRVNHEPALLAADLAASVAAGADGVVLPKVESAEELISAAADIDQYERQAGAIRGSIKFVALIETPPGLGRLAEIAHSSPRLVAMAFGSEDFSAAMGIAPRPEAMAYPAQALAIAAVAAGLHPLGLPGSVAEFNDREAYTRLAVQARSLGLRGAVCIHPSQVTVLNQVFGASEAELAEARQLVTAFDAAVANGTGAIAVNGRMVDAPIAQRARRLLSRHARRAV